MPKEAPQLKNARFVKAGVWTHRNRGVVRIGNAPIRWIITGDSHEQYPTMLDAMSKLNGLPHNVAKIT